MTEDERATVLQALDATEVFLAAVADKANEKVTSLEAIVLAARVRKVQAKCVQALDGTVPEGDALDDRIYAALRSAEAIAIAFEILAGARHCLEHPDGCPHVLACTRKTMEEADVLVRGDRMTEFLLTSAGQRRGMA